MLSACKEFWWLSFTNKNVLIGISQFKSLIIVLSACKGFGDITINNNVLMGISQFACLIIVSPSNRNTTTDQPTPDYLNLVPQFSNFKYKFLCTTIHKSNKQPVTAHIPVSFSLLYQSCHFPLMNSVCMHAPQQYCKYKRDT